MPKVSVIMPAYNSVTTVQRALASLQAQTYTDIEIVVVDDMSTDGTYEHLEAAAKDDPRIKLIRMPQNTGPSHVRNVALSHITGEWVTNLDIDDWFEPGRIEALLRAATTLDADMVVDNLRIYDHALNKIVRHTNYGSARGVAKLTAENFFRLDNPLRRESIGYTKPLMRVKFLRDHKVSYWEKYRNNEDFLFLAEAVMLGARAYIIPEPYYVYVHRISPKTRKVSPHSHSAHDTALFIAQASDELLEKYALLVSAKARRYLLRRKHIFLTSKIAGQQTGLVLQHHYGKAVWMFYEHPSLVLYRAIGVRNRLYNMFLSVFRRDYAETPPPVKFSLVLATINRTTELEKFLNSVVAQKYPKVDVILVDQNPQGFLDPLVENFRDKVSIRHLRSMPGLSRARNVGLSYADGDVVAFPDDDCIYPPGLLSKVNQALSNMSYDGFVAVPFSPEGKPVLRHWRRPGKISRGKIFRQAISFGVFLRRHIVENVGRFDESLGVGAGTLWGSGEETDFLLRALNKNAHIAYDPETRVLHPIPSTPDPSKVAAYARGLGRVTRKNGYGLIDFAPFMLKPLAAAAFYFASRKPERSSHYMMIARSRWQGYASHPAPAEASLPPDMPLVSVIMPAYNATGTIRKALESLQAQTYPNLEIIVVDDMSTDGTYELVQECAREDTRIKLFQTPHNLGNGGASRMAAEKATGEWISILDADDWCEATRIDALVKAALALKADVVIDNLQVFDHSMNQVVHRTNYGSSRAVTKLNAEDIFRMDNPLRRSSVGYSKPLMRAKFLRDHNLNYWGKYRDNEDFILLAEIILSGAKAFVIPGAHYVYVHRISPTTRRVSPHSRSAADTALLIAQASDELMEKYQSSIPDNVRRAVLRRKEIFMTSQIAGKQTTLAMQGQLGKATILFFEHPALVSYRMVGIMNRIGDVLRKAS